MAAVGLLLHYAIQFFVIALIVRVIFSWIPEPPSPLDKVDALATAMTEWACAPIRRLLPPVPMGGIALDLSVLVVFFLAQGANQLVSLVFY